MNPVALEPLAKAVLRGLYELAELDCPADASVLARALTLGGVPTRASEVVRALLVLEARGLAEAERARLSMMGLALAVRCPALRLASLPALAQLRRQVLQLRQAERPRACGRA